MPLTGTERLLNSRILIVDDTPHNVEIVSEALEDAGYTGIETTTSPEEGLALIAQQPYDLILLDIRMPRIDGFEFIRRAAPLYGERPIPVVVLTAQIDEETRRRALAAGVRDFLTKPLQLWELQLRVKNTLSMELLYREVAEQNFTLEQKVAERTAELERTRHEIIRRLATAGEFRDNDTGQHVTRMSYFAHRLAELAGLSPKDARLILEAAPLHDVGKIGIPDAILLKPGKLDAQEWEIMKRHAEIGGQILADSESPLLQLAHTIAMTHHEKWDGTGYPKGLKGEEIPLSGRIIAVCDVFDALSSARPYKQAWPLDKIIALLEEGAGQHFDPHLIDLFLTDLPHMLSIRDRFQDELTEVA